MIAWKMGPVVVTMMCQDLEMLKCLFEGMLDDGALVDYWVGNCPQGQEEPASTCHGEEPRGQVGKQGGTCSWTVHHKAEHYCILVT